MHKKKILKMTGYHTETRKQILMRIGRKGNTSHCWWEDIPVQLLWKVMKITQESGNKII